LAQERANLWVPVNVVTWGTSLADRLLASGEALCSVELKLF